MTESPDCEWLTRLPKDEEDELRAREDAAGLEVFVDAGHARKFPRAWTCALCRVSGMSIHGCEAHVYNELGFPSLRKDGLWLAADHTARRHNGSSVGREHYWPDLDRFAPATGDFWVHPPPEEDRRIVVRLGY